MRPIYIIQHYSPSVPDPDGGNMRLLGRCDARHVTQQEYEAVVAAGAQAEAGPSGHHYARIYARLTDVP